MGLSKEEEKSRFSHKLPAGTEWKNFSFQFANKNEVIVHVRRFTETLSFIDMHLPDGRHNKPKPNEGWIFFWVMAQYHGELTIKDPDAKDRYKKQKEFLSNALKYYFRMESDPFYPYPEKKSYRTRFTLLPPAEENAEVLGNSKKQDLHPIVEVDIVDEEIRQFFEKQTSQPPGKKRYDEKYR